MIAIRGGEVVLPSRVASGATVLVEESRIAGVETSGAVSDV